MSDPIIIFSSFLTALSGNLLAGAALLCAVFNWLGRHDRNSASAAFQSRLYRALPSLFFFWLCQAALHLLSVAILFPAIYSGFEAVRNPVVLSVAATVALGAFCMQQLYLGKTDRKQSSPEPYTATLLLFMTGILISAGTTWFQENYQLFLMDHGLARVASSLTQGALTFPSNYYSQSAFLHYSVASIAIGGLALALGLYESGQKDKDSVQKKARIKSGAFIFLIATVLQAPVGGFYYNMLPAEMMARIAGSDQAVSTIFGTSLLLMTIATGCLARAALTAGRFSLITGSVATAGTVLCMMASRHQMRTMAMEPYLNIEAHPDLISTETTLAIIIILLALANWLFYLKKRLFDLGGRGGG